MSILQFTDITLLSTAEISKTIVETKNQLFHLNLKKTTRQNFKSHKIKFTKRRLAQLKTLLSSKVINFEQREEENKG